MNEKIGNFIVKLTIGFAIFGLIVFLTIIPGLLPFLGIVSTITLAVMVFKNKKESDKKE